MDPSVSRNSNSKNLYFCDEEITLWYLFSTLFIVFVISFVLSFFSLGFFFFIFIYILAELFYAVGIGFRYSNLMLSVRLCIFIVATIAFVLGRFILCDDDSPFRHSFHEFI